MLHDADRECPSVERLRLAGADRPECGSEQHLRVDDFVAVQDVGKVVHPILAAGQIEGGVAQAIGFTLYENVVWQNGRRINNQMTNYIIPTAADIPPIRVFFEEMPYAYGPAGAKGIGELPMDGPAPAILNAIEHATGVAFDHVPLTPEALAEKLGESLTGEDDTG